jgi:hypothetical protein
MLSLKAGVLASTSSVLYMIDTPNYTPSYGPRCPLKYNYSSLAAYMPMLTLKHKRPELLRILMVGKLETRSPISSHYHSAGLAARPASAGCGPRGTSVVGAIDRG